LKSSPSSDLALCDNRNGFLSGVDEPMANKTVRRSINITPEMRDMLAQIAAKQGRDITEADLIRDAIRTVWTRQTRLSAAADTSRNHCRRIEAI
ncbi:MAG: hypothetical protein IPM16_15010, partial [Chloroflexi bacterium]|nr:hypothetical protein [Chloroflexota bacterium]